MNASLFFSLSLGIALGLFFFGGLWWTVQKGLKSSRPAFWFMSSLLVRGALVLCGFYFVAGSNWMNLAACLFGFVIARFIAMRLPAGASHEP